MGKRKYEDNSTSDNKKTKTENNSENINDTENDVEQPQKEQNVKTQNRNISKNALFDIKHFRKELTAKQGQTMGKIKLIY